ncbi:MAG: MBL fold metallo-hydrolase [Lachnospiraceae bacterium]|jgi:7,8-dihydropterin-6-yl-methyl-4-(beta-D-ribofuranosyl)aminobenzene 5'-phosphate synthase|nr:MBL fold metallo-hydrolase [Lachnospiraceae bacterium]
MKAWVLVDNIPQPNLPGEWGLSIYIEYNGTNVLLDTGASRLFLKNAQKLGKSIEAVDYGVLSHAHYDHADGMRAFFQENLRAPFYLQQGSGENCYKKKWLLRKYIGLPRGILKEYEERMVFTRGNHTLCPGVHLLSHSTQGLERIGQKNHMYIRTKNGWAPDNFSHEQSLVFETEKGLVIFNSCSHGGADNIIREVKEAWPRESIRALIGGFHIYSWTKEEVRGLARRILETGIQEIYTGHCTGSRSFEILQEELEGRAHQLKTGLEMEL